MRLTGLPESPPKNEMVAEIGPPNTEALSTDPQASRRQPR
jgi:hypothetical protein